MRKDVTIQEMREHFDEHLDEVRDGVTLRLMDGGKAVAEISRPSTDDSDPLKDMIWRKAIGSFADFVPPPPIESDIDVVALLREDRDAR